MTNLNVTELEVAVMGKVELRAACKAAGISYGKLNNDGMRAALVAAAAQRMTPDELLRSKGAVTAKEFFSEVPGHEDFEATPEELAKQAVRPQEYPVADPSTMSYSEVHDALCPGCGIHLSNGLLQAEDTLPNKDVTYYEAGLNNREYECMGCGHQFGKESAPYVKPAAKPDAHTGKGLKIEKVREERNGVKRPSAGGKCAQVWDALDAFVAEEKLQPTIAIVKDIAEDEGWNVTNATIEFYNWRKFNGISGRAAK